jgi:hypothetical protein
MKVELAKELQVYKELLVEEMDMFIGLNGGFVTHEEYVAQNRLGAAIEAFLEEGFGVEIINKTRWNQL